MQFVQFLRRVRRLKPPERFNPSEPFYLQWHLTDRCNLECRHCYRAAPKTDLTFPDVTAILDNFLEFRKTLPQPRARVQITGGEPLLSPHLIPLLDAVAAAGLAARVLTNGTLVTDELARELKRVRVQAVQVSIDGDRSAHDGLRGAGNYDRAVAGIGTLKRRGLAVTVAMTLSRASVAGLPAVLDLAARRADRIGFHRLVPCGRGEQMREEVLAPAEIFAAYSTIRRFQDERPELEYSLRDPLWKPWFDRALPDRFVDGCSAGWGGICIDNDGTVFPCRRLPLPLGNALQDDLTALWGSELMDELRDRDRLGGKCGACHLRRQCGGCRAIARAATGDHLAADPQCFDASGPARRWLHSAQTWLAARRG